jgi:hypothetical protein
MGRGAAVSATTEPPAEHLPPRPPQVRRLLSGEVTLYELTMTGGLWRLTGERGQTRGQTQPCRSNRDDYSEAHTGGLEPCRLAHACRRACAQDKNETAARRQL